MEVAAVLYRPTSGGVTYPWMISLPNRRVCGSNDLVPMQFLNPMGRSGYPETDLKVIWE